MAAPMPYLDLKADERQEIRMPSLLKEHLAQVARLHGQSVSEYAIRVLATDVSMEIAKSLEWQLTAPEFLELMKMLVSPAPETAAMAAARSRAAELFETVPSAG